MSYSYSIWQAFNRLILCNVCRRTHKYYFIMGSALFFGAIFSVYQIVREGGRKSIVVGFVMGFCVFPMNTHADIFTHTMHDTCLLSASWYIYSYLQHTCMSSANEMKYYEIGSIHLFFHFYGIGVVVWCV